MNFLVTSAIQLVDGVFLKILKCFEVKLSSTESSIGCKTQSLNWSMKTHLHESPSYILSLGQ